MKLQKCATLICSFLLISKCVLLLGLLSRDGTEWFFAWRSIYHWKIENIHKMDTLLSAPPPVIRFWWGRGQRFGIWITEISRKNYYLDEGGSQGYERGSSLLRKELLITKGRHGGRGSDEFSELANLETFPHFSVQALL